MLKHQQWRLRSSFSVCALVDITDHYIGIVFDVARCNDPMRTRTDRRTLVSYRYRKSIDLGRGARLSLTIPTYRDVAPLLDA